MVWELFLFILKFFKVSKDLTPISLEKHFNLNCIQWILRIWPLVMQNYRLSQSQHKLVLTWLSKKGAKQTRTLNQVALGKWKKQLRIVSFLRHFCFSKCQSALRSVESNKLNILEPFWSFLRENFKFCKFVEVSQFFWRSTNFYTVL